ncbi:MAG TPA: VWA domain-containing protein [Thermoanaerobaculia bacterium]|nr:VWA domain-containing protein [Thermoanaerobaculia bacterium]
MQPKTVVVGCLLLLPAWAGAQDAPSAPAAPPVPKTEPTFTETVEVREAEVEVLVTDRDGKPVPGLMIADFRVLEDGKPVEVTHVTPTAAQPLVVGLFLDDTSLAGASRSVAISGLRRFLTSILRPGDRALILHYDGSLEVQDEPTGDLAKLGATLDRIGKTAVRGSLMMQERNSIQNDLFQSHPQGGDTPTEQAIGEMDATEILNNIRRYEEMRSNATRAALAALQQALALLTTLPERKALVYIGGGLPLSPGADLREQWTERYPDFVKNLAVSPLEGLTWDATRVLQDTADRANAASITIHTLGLPETGGAVASSAGRGGGTRSGWDPEDSETALRTLAGATGGLVRTDLQNPAPFLEAAARQLGSTYVVGYTPSTGGGRKGRHKLDVKVRDGALAARFREERFDGKGIDPLLRSALASLWAGGDKNPLQAELQIEEQAKEADGRFRVTAILTFPLAQILVQPQENYHVGHLTLAVAVRDGKGRLSGVPRAEVPVEIPNQRLLSAPGQTAGYRFTVRLFPGQSILAVAMRDDLSGTEGVIKTALDLGSKVSR